MKVIIAGGRDFDNYEWLSFEMNKILVSEVVCGDASGADSLGAKWAYEHGIPVKHFPADWNTYGRAAGPIRNAQMAEYAEFLVAFWDGQSHGTKSMIDIMQQTGKHGKVFMYEIKDNF